MYNKAKERELCKASKSFKQKKNMSDFHFKRLICNKTSWQLPFGYRQLLSMAAITLRGKVDEKL